MPATEGTSGPVHLVRWIDHELLASCGEDSPNRTVSTDPQMADCPACQAAEVEIALYLAAHRCLTDLTTEVER